MSDHDRRFVDRALAGEVMIDEIDDFVDDWHDNPGDLPLYEPLGFTKDEYALWLRSSDSLPLILSSRKLIPTAHETGQYQGPLVSGQSGERGLR